MKRNSHWLAKCRILLIVFAMSAVVTTSIVAYFTKNTGEVTNDFTPAEIVNPEVKETFELNLVKKDVYFYVGNTGYPVYVRAAIIITWKDANDIVYYKKPVEGTDYTITLNTTDWVARESLVETGDEYYYLKSRVESGKDTPVLIKECTQILTDAPSGYTLSVDIIVQTVQAVGTTDEDNSNGVIPAWEDAWGPVWKDHEWGKQE